MKTLSLAALLAAILPAAAQDAPLKVLYQPWHGRNAYILDKVMDLVLARPEFARAARADAATLVVSVPQLDYRVGNSENIPYDFTLHFQRDGGDIGEARESCASAQPAACADLVAGDLSGAAAIHR